ncbi:MAG: Ni/Fe hydrogenase subunit alpha [Roseiflexaceae bacterium]|nr:Ni/Fe hydrogenase subunit alpha [Roseiflexaceae bacterium]
MTQRIVIDPVSRIEGHAKISIFLDDQGEVSNARFHVTEFRGFERFCEGRPLWEMAGITSRICGICPVSHLLASAKTGDAILAVRIPLAADKLRRLQNLGQIIQSHALSFFHLSAPDLLLGFESDPATRNVFGLIAAEPELARGGIRLRQFGQEIIEALGGSKVHPAWAVPGGVRAALAPDARERLLARLPEVYATAKLALARFKTLLDPYATEIRTFGTFPSLFMGLVTPEGRWEHYDGRLRFSDASGAIIADQVDPARYQEYLGESVEHDSFLKSPYYKPYGFPAGMYRVGPLARLNICSEIGTPLADAELAEYRQRYGHPATSSFCYHYARLIEILAAIEHIEILLNDPDVIQQPQAGSAALLRASAGINQLEGVGCSEAPRGTLLRHYQVDANGLIKHVNLIIATGQNNLAMNATVTQIAKHYIHNNTLSEGILNRVEAGVRAYDPCLSCSTHAAGTMPLEVSLIGADGQLLDRVAR